MTRRVLASVSLLVFFFSLSLLGEERVKIQTDPSFAARGGNMWVTCWIPKHPDNRGLTIGMPWHRTTWYDIEGSKAPKMFRFLVQEIPCLPVTAAICQLRTNKDDILASKPIQVMGCN